jgi:predicted dehydrogenase
MKIGIIGCGRVAVDRHLPAIRSLGNVQVVAAADHDAQRLAYATHRFHITRQHRDYAKMLQDPEIEAVGVFVPLEHHFETAAAVLDAGKHLLLEKPMCRTQTEADRLVKKAGGVNLKAMMAFNRRFHRMIRRARQLVQGGRLGPVRLVSVAASSGQDAQKVPSWRLSRASGGGCLIEDASHFYDLWRFLLDDEIDEVFALSQSIRGSDDEPAVITARTVKGVLLSCALSDFAPNRHEMEIFGDNSVLSLSPHRFEGIELTPAGTCAGDIAARIRRLVTFLRELPWGLRQHRHGGDYNASFSAEWRHFIDCIQNDLTVESSLEDGRRALQVTLAAIRSATEKKCVRVDQCACAMPKRTAR